MTLNMLQLILGGARSGKSRYAEQIVVQSGLKRIYIATAQAFDDEMTQRIAAHQKRRSDDWLTLEEPLALANTLRLHAAEDRCILVDCLTLWLSNCLGENEDRFNRERAELIATLPSLPGKILFVSNEVGQGIVPINPLARRFVDEAGWLHQDLAAVCQKVVLITAGLPLVLKETP